MARKKATFGKDDLIEIYLDLAMDNTELRWGKPVSEEPFLHSGRYIVDHASPTELWLADADWDEDGNITFHSGKHGHIIRGRKSIEALKKMLKKLTE